MAPLNHTYTPSLSTYYGMQKDKRERHVKPAGPFSRAVNSQNMVTTPAGLQKPSEKCKLLPKNNKHERRGPRHGGAKRGACNIRSTAATPVSSEQPAFPHGGRVNKSERLRAERCGPSGEPCGSRYPSSTSFNHTGISQSRLKI